MARENQGLQIALIVFVMLTIILGVTTYLFYRQYEEADIKAKNNLAERDKANNLARQNEDEANSLKGLIGVPKTDKFDAISAVFNEDMTKYGASYPDEVRFYRPLIEKMGKTIDELNGKLAAAEDATKKLIDEFRQREASRDPQLKNFEQERDKAKEDLTEEQTKFKDERTRITREATKLKNDLETARKEAAASIAQIEQKYQSAVAQVQKLLGINKTLSDRQEQLTAQKFEVPNGEITWVNQRTGTVWIDLGRADSLSRQVTFSVYPADSSEMAAGGKKGSIEVTQILGDHLAEARLFDDKISDPIMPGDKIFTPVWTPGDKRHFALAGLIDIDGDGTSDLQTVKDIIQMNGGVVDCFIDEQGKRTGEMSVNTRYLVLGEVPTEKGQPAMIAAFTKLRSEAERLGVQKVQLVDLLQRMGWKNQTPMVRFDQGANMKDFAPKPGMAPQKKSIGSVSDVFKPRQPPARANP